MQELDFRHEASNCFQFGESLRFIGYVDVPKTLPELTTRRALAMEWVYGRHLSDLSPEEAMRMTYMSVEAVTAGLVLTGQVHADPHEGNIMLADDGRLVFLDFGLMSKVEDDIMEAFASGIQVNPNPNPNPNPGAAPIGAPRHALTLSRCRLTSRLSLACALA